MRLKYFTSLPGLTDGQEAFGIVDANNNIKVTSTSSTSDAAAIGAVNETAPATDTASSGLNGRLQRIAQRLTSLIALLPASLGAKTGANSFSIVPASDATFTVLGSVASAAADSGNPVKVGGRNNTTVSGMLTDGQRGDLQLETDASLRVSLVGGNTTGADGQNNTGLVSASQIGNKASASVRPLTVANFAFNGSTWDRLRNNMDTAALITAAGATTSQTGADQTNYNGRGLIVVLDMTTVGTGSVTLTIQGKDAASGKYYTLLAGAAVTTNSTNVYTVYPGAPTTANVSAAFPLPRTWRVITTANNANATTYTVGASVIV